MMTTAQIHQLQHTTLEEKTMKLKTLRRSQTFCTRTNPKQPDPNTSSDEYDELEEEDVSSTEDENQKQTPINNNNNIRNSRSQPSLRRVTPVDLSITSSLPSSSSSSSSTSLVERVLPNGDLYTGSFLGNAPNGHGKYLWCDGCMYEGEWRKGKACGRGKFSWPSGATYEGEFKGGRMNGSGTYIGIEGDTYRGMWVGDKKEGKGEKLYANGDVYEGMWRDNVQDGEGKYVWKNGNVYVGEWRNGVIFGKGVLIWANGNKYQGCWENGVPNGAGVFTRPDGSTYAGNWGNSSNNGNDGGDCDKVLGEVTEKRVGEGGGRMSVSERGVNFPRICIWEADEDAGEITCDIIDNVEVKKLYKEGSRNSLYEHGGGGMRNRVSKNNSMKMSASPRECHNVSPRPYWCGGGGDEVKKPGQPISRGHKNYELMLNLQLGIR